MIVTNTIKQNIPEVCIKINNAPLEICKSYKYLGVVIDEKLNWDAHIKHITPKISKACGALARLRNCISIEVIKNVYHALIYSYLRYGILIWGNASQSVLAPLQIFFSCFYSTFYPPDPLCRNMSWAPKPKAEVFIGPQSW